MLWNKEKIEKGKKTWKEYQVVNFVPTALFLILTAFLWSVFWLFVQIDEETCSGKFMFKGLRMCPASFQSPPVTLSTTPTCLTVSDSLNFGIFSFEMGDDVTVHLYCLGLQAWAWRLPTILSYCLEGELVILKLEQEIISHKGKKSACIL